MLLISLTAWKEENDDDVNVISSLSSGEYESMVQVLTRKLGEYDLPLAPVYFTFLSMLTLGSSRLFIPATF